MAYKPSKAQQETALGEGLAIGTLALGVESVPSDKLAIEFAFRHAWPRWEHNYKFPVVKANLDRTDILRILHDAEGRRGAYVASWATDRRTFEPYLRQDWPIEEAAESVGEDYGVNLSGWTALAGSWLTDMGIIGAQ